jgi:hypothetical protein
VNKFDALPYKGFLRDGWVFVCPACRTFKAYPAKLGEQHGIKCADNGTIKNVGAPEGCGLFTSELIVTQFVGMEMVEE